MRGRPVFRSSLVGLAVGLAGLAVAWFALYDAYEARGRRAPAVLRPFTWW
jgi:hypothetical protein